MFSLLHTLHVLFTTHTTCSRYYTHYMFSLLHTLHVIQIHTTVSSLANGVTSSQLLHSRLHDFPVILKRMLQNYWKIMKKYFIGTTWTAMLSTYSNIQSLSDVLPVAKGLKTCFSTISPPLSPLPPHLLFFPIHHI